jgi:predicted nucleic acid-binding protein
VIVLDTSVLVDAVTQSNNSATAIRRLIFEAEDLVLPTLVLFEWLNGPRSAEDLAWQEELFPAEFAIPFGVEEAHIAADLYRTVARARGRKFDLAIAACAISREVPLWTLNSADFDDLPSLRLYLP